MLTEMAGKDIPGSVLGHPALHHVFQLQSLACVPEIKPLKHTGSVTEMSSMLPNLGKLADDLYRAKPQHRSGQPRRGHLHDDRLANSRTPKHGSLADLWTGSESKDLPAFVVMTSTDKGKPAGNSSMITIGSGFCPAVPGVKFSSSGAPVPYLENPPGGRAGRRAPLTTSPA